MNADLLLRDVWRGGRLLAFSAIDGPTEFNEALTLRTMAGPPALECRLPGRCVIRFPEAAESRHWLTGDCFEIGTARGSLLDAFHLLIEGPCAVSEADEKITVETRGHLTLVGSASRFDAGLIESDVDAAIRDRCSWLNARTIPSEALTTRRTLALALSLMKTQVCSPQGIIKHPWTTPDRWPHRHMWLWDSVFHAIGFRHIAPQLARDMISAVAETQRGDGFISHLMHPWGTSEITQPPVLALGVKLVNEVAPDAEWVKSLYPRLGAYVEWDLANRDSDGDGLAEWFIESSPTSRSGESGMDNSPRFDAATQLDATDFNAFLSLECEILAGFARELGLTGDAAEWTARHERLNRLIRDRLWSDEQEFFLDYDVDRRTPSPVLASSGFLPLICGAATREQAAMLAGHLRNPDTFATALPVPSIAVRDTAHYAKDMWRGPTWVNVNWLIARGFDRYGMGEVAGDLRRRTVEQIERYAEGFGVFFEYYDDRLEVDPPALMRKGKCAPEASPYHQVFHDFGWTATLYADLVYSGGLR